MKARLYMPAMLAVLAAPCSAAKYAIDGVHSSVGFKIRHFRAKVTGQFGKFSGEIDYDEKAPAKAKVEAVISAASIDTRNQNRDNHLRSADFFDVEKFPEISFRSAKSSPSGEGRIKVEGMLRMRGVEKPVTLEVSALGEAEAAPGKVKAGFSARTAINRKDFGIVWNKALDAGGFVLGDEVEIEIEIEADKRP